MRLLILKAVCCLMVGLSALLSASSDNADAKVRVRLVDATTGKPRGGIVRIFRAGEERPLKLAGLFDRLQGLERSETVAGWYVVPAAGAEIALPRAKLRIEALSGLETALTRQEADLSAKVPEAITITLMSVFDPGRHGLVAGNTHLHLRNLTSEQCNEYLRQIP